MTLRWASTVSLRSSARAWRRHRAAGQAPAGTAARGVVLAALLSSVLWLALAAWAWLDF